jgi:hypothetical protein
VPAELVAERREDLRAVGIVLARAEPGEERERDDRRRDVAVDRLLDGPAALPGIGHPALEVREVRVLRERPFGQFEQPRTDDRTVVPDPGDAREVELVVARMHDLEAFGIGLHEPVFDPVVDHLHVMACAGPPTWR